MSHRLTTVLNQSAVCVWKYYSNIKLSWSIALSWVCFVRGFSHDPPYISYFSPAFLAFSLPPSCEASRLCSFPPQLLWALLFLTSCTHHHPWVFRVCLMLDSIFFFLPLPLSALNFISISSIWSHWRPLVQIKPFTCKSIQNKCNHSLCLVFLFLFSSFNPEWEPWQGQASL